MKLIDKPRLPKWLIATIPFGEEEEWMSGFVVPFVLFSLMGVGMMWYEFCNDFIPYLGVVITISVIVVIALIVWWLIVHVDVLRILRKRLELHYKITENEEERLKTKEKLLDLCVKVGLIKT